MEKKMSTNKIHRFQTDKEMESIIKDIEKSINEKGILFDWNSSLDMKKTYKGHNIDLPEDFDVRMIRLCSPPRSSQALLKNPERASVTPRFITFFKQEGKTQIRFLDLGAEEITALLGDVEFSKAYAQFNHTIVEIINHCLT